MSRRSPKSEVISDEGPIYTVYLDSESFVWLRTLLEARLKYRYLPAYLEQVRRVLIAFDEAAKANGDTAHHRVIPRQGGRKK